MCGGGVDLDRGLGQGQQLGPHPDQLESRNCASHLLVEKGQAGDGGAQYVLIPLLGVLMSYHLMYYNH